VMSANLYRACRGRPGSIDQASLSQISPAAAARLTTWPLPYVRPPCVIVRLTIWFPSGFISQLLSTSFDCLAPANRLVAACQSS